MFSSFFCRFMVSSTFVLLICGCGNDKLPLGKVEGKVLYQGKPLEFGSVMFQPEKGPIAKSTIRSDGTFVLSTYVEGDGAVIGSHAVQVRCFSSQNPNAPRSNSNGETSLGQLLIPKKYTRYGTSGLTAEVAKENEPIVLNLE